MEKHKPGRDIKECDRTRAITIRLSESEYKKLVREAWLRNMSINAFIRMALGNEYKKILDEEVRQYGTSGMCSEIHRQAWKPDTYDSGGPWTDWDDGGDRKAGAES